MVPVLCARPRPSLLQVPLIFSHPNPPSPATSTYMPMICTATGIYGSEHPGISLLHCTPSLNLRHLHRILNSENSLASFDAPCIFHLHLRKYAQKTCRGATLVSHFLCSRSSSYINTLPFTPKTYPHTHLDRRATTTESSAHSG